MRNPIRIIVFAFYIALYSVSVAYSANDPKWLFACAPNNDLYRVMTDNGMACERYSTAIEAIEHAENGATVLILADDYPFETTKIKTEEWKTASDKKLKLYVEYPSTIPGMDVGDIQFTEWERGVVASDAFGSALTAMRILAIQDCHYLKVDAKNPLLVIARVAGFNTAVYGLPKTSQPILFQHPTNYALIATTKLSQFVTARYTPYSAWQTVWKTLLSKLSGREVPAFTWDQTVYPTYAKQDSLPADVEENAFEEGVEWFYDSNLLVNPKEEKNIALQLEQGYIN
ncbi:hypothetical protein K8I31_04450, partial [bacterium]|nr:hypothetical protein [bacterium]